VKQQFDRLLDSARVQTVNLKRLEAETAKIRHWMAATQSSSDSQEKLLRFIDSVQAARGRVAERLFLKALAFQEIHSRIETVVGAHQDTFQWIFDDANRPDNTGHGCLPGKKFTQWLSSSDRIFHIAGKLGSGKSTLMKFLFSHPRTHSELQKWAGEVVIDCPDAVYTC
jgi:ATPase subunit of ABC transporter with duplicated ATPase domains